ncbi:MAG: oligosaccharide flippase family protein [Cytophagales bacterium]|nr:oligosaccharide flippase family protein [Cytophagales bacterium]
MGMKLPSFVYKILNLGLRVGGIGIRFLLTFFIGKYFSFDFLGEYSLVNTTVTLSLLFIGVDFYVYATRELLARKYENQFTIVVNQGLFILCSYLLLLPVLSLVFYFDVLPVHLIALFYGVVILEHLGMELYRFFINIEKSLFANLLLFIRSASWVVVLCLTWWLNNIKNPSIDIILVHWLVGALVSNIIGFGYLLYYYKGSYTNVIINFSWIKAGVLVSVKLLFATVAQKVIEFSDRYMIDHYLGKKELGVYSFYFQISNLINVVVYTLVIMMLYPKLYKAIFSEDANLIESIKRRMLRDALFICLIFTIIEVFSIGFLTNILGKPEVMEYKNILYLLLGTTFIFNTYLIYKSSLQAYKLDNVVLSSSILGAIFNFVFNFVYIGRLGLYAPAISTIISYLLMTVILITYERKQV